MSSVIFIGASHAAAQGCISLRQMGWEGEIIVIGDEKVLPYHRPPLSKAVLSGEKTCDEILIRPTEAYKKAGVEMKLGMTVTDIDSDNMSISINNGEVLKYDKLVLTTGARARRLPIDGADSKNVFYLRDLEDLLAIRSKVAVGHKAVIIGGGYIGLETAASLKKLGMHITVLEAMDRILQRVTAPVMSDFYRRMHTEEGVVIVEGEMASVIDEREDGLVVHSSDGNEYHADIVIVGIGVIPNTELAQACGIDVGNGIIVNEYSQTSDENIYACGDVTWHYNPIYDRHLRLESVPNASEQSKVAAAHITGKPVPYNSSPWFWSDQFDAKLQIAGLSSGYDDIVLRGAPNTDRSFAAFYFNGNKLLAVDAVNSPREFMVARMALSKGKTLDKSALDNQNTDLKSIIR